MGKIFKAVWRVISFPFWLVYKLIIFPFHQIHNFINFLNEDIDDNSLIEIVSGIVTDKERQAAFWDHIEDLRKHLLRAVLAVVIAVGITFVYTVPVMEFLAAPIGGLTNLQAIQVTEEVGAYMKIALSLGITVAFPYIIFEMWWFAAPGLRPRERKFGLLSIPFATLLYVAGMVFAYVILIPPALNLLGGFTEISQKWTAKEYFDFVNGLIFWMGISFEFPLVIYVLTAIGFVKPKFLAQQWRLAIVIIAVLAAAITPTVDPINMSLVMGPLTLLYFISIGLSYLALAGRRQPEFEPEIKERE